MGYGNQGSKTSVQMMSGILFYDAREKGENEQM